MAEISTAETVRMYKVQCAGSSQIESHSYMSYVKPSSDRVFRCPKCDDVFERESRQTVEDIIKAINALPLK